MDAIDVCSCSSFSLSQIWINTRTRRTSHTWPSPSHMDHIFRFRQLSGKCTAFGGNESDSYMRWWWKRNGYADKHTDCGRSVIWLHKQWNELRRAMMTYHFDIELGSLQIKFDLCSGIIDICHVWKMWQPNGSHPFEHKSDMHVRSLTKWQIFALKCASVGERRHGLIVVVGICTCYCQLP